MTNKPEFFWSPPDGAPIVGMTQYRDFIVVATASGVYVIREDASMGLDRHIVERVMDEQEAGLKRQALATGAVGQGALK